jgi:hypothetical protein
MNNVFSQIKVRGIRWAKKNTGAIADDKFIKK